jgi:hypothetical protein
MVQLGDQGSFDLSFVAIGSPSLHGHLAAVGACAASLGASFLRFIVTAVRRESGVEDGLFGSAYRLQDHSALDVAKRETLSETLAWF